MTFTITVQNYGTLDAILDSIDISNSGSYVIIYGIEGIQQGTRLLAGESKTFTITTEFDINAVSIPDNPVKELTVTLNYIQDDGQSLTPSDPVIPVPTLADIILEDNEEKNDSNIDFSKSSEEDGTKGLYYTNQNTEDGKTVYYYRGAVENNYVSFADFYWRIVRINEDKSVRLIYQGEVPDTTGSAATIGESSFNTDTNDNAYLGYMYGFIPSSNYDSAHANVNDSTIKTMLDAWYRNNLVSYASYITDSGFCGDRSVASVSQTWFPNDTTFGYGEYITYYGVTNRMFNIFQPQYKCPQNEDLYTMYGKGNNMLSYPIGLITVDEVIYAGGNAANVNSSYYLYENIDYWTMSPLYYEYGAFGSIVRNMGYLYYNNVVSTAGVRPVINLKSNVEISGGDGTSSNPYVVSTN